MAAERLFRQNFDINDKFLKQVSSNLHILFVAKKKILEVHSSLIY